MGAGRKAAGVGGVAGAIAAAGLALALTPLTAGASGQSVAIDDSGLPPTCSGGNPYCFVPSSVTINVGDSVTWTSHSTTDHTVTADNGSFDSGNRRDGQTFSHPFNTPGTFTYHCAYHSFMTGTVKVNGTASSSSSTAPHSSSSTTSHTSTTTHTTTTTTTTTSHASTTSTPAPTSAAPTGAPVALGGTQASPGAVSTSSSSNTNAVAAVPPPSSGGPGGGVIAVIVVAVLGAAGGLGVWLRRSPTA